MKFVLIPDSFKGTLSSEQICEIAKEKVEKHFPGAETACVPVADGGEGSVDAFITALGGSKVTVKVKNPYFEDMDSYYGLINEGKTAVIEMASCAGLPLVEDLHMVPAHSMEEALEKAKAIVKKDDYKVTVIPDGVSVIVRE